MNWDVIILDGTLSNTLIVNNKEYGYIFPNYNDGDFIDKTIEDILAEVTGIQIQNYKHNISLISKNLNGFVYIIQLFEYINNIFINPSSSWHSISNLINYINQNSTSCSTSLLYNKDHLKYILTLSR